MNIGLDLDGVVYPWHWSMYRYFCEWRGFNGTQKEFWNYFGTLELDSQSYYVSLHTLYSDTSIMEDAEEYIPLLAELGTLFYITSRPQDLIRQTEKFFDKNNLPFKENLIFSGDKVNHIKVNKIQYYIDDLPYYIDQVSPHTKAFLRTRPHNIDSRDGYTTVDSLKEFYKFIKEDKTKKELGYLE